jgi:hypothetical protein
MKSNQLDMKRKIQALSVIAKPSAKARSKPEGGDQVIRIGDCFALQRTQSSQ